MILDWRREDSAYAAATAAAAILVAYLVAGNFGLVPTPFAPSVIDQGARLTVPAFVAATEGTPEGTVPSATPGATAAAGLPPSTSTPLPGDDDAPAVAFTTEDGATVSGVTEGAVVEGTASDPSSGVAGVVVTFQSSTGGPTPVQAQLTCDRGKRNRCAWTAEAPDAAGTYSVIAHVKDRAGHTGKAGPIEVTVVNPGGPLEDLIGEGPLGGLGDLLGLTT